LAAAAMVLFILFAIFVPFMSDLVDICPANALTCTPQSRLYPVTDSLTYHFFRFGALTWDSIYQLRIS